MLLTKFIWNDFCYQVIVKKCDIKHYIFNDLQFETVVFFILLQNRD